MSAAPRQHGDGHDDAFLIAAEQQLEDLWARADQAYETEGDDAGDPIMYQAHALVDRIVATPSQSLDGAAVKLRIILHPTMGLPDAERTSHVPLLEDVQAVIRGTITTSNPIQTAVGEADQAFVDLWRRWERLSCRWHQTPEAVLLAGAEDRLSDESVIVEDTIVARPAASIIGVAIKLRLFVALEPPEDHTFTTEIFNSIVADVERLAGVS